MYYLVTFSNRVEIAPDITYTEQTNLYLIRKQIEPVFN